MKFKILFESWGGYYYFKLIANNNACLVTSNGYSDKAKALKAIAMVKKCAKAKIIEEV